MQNDMAKSFGNDWMLYVLLVSFEIDTCDKQESKWFYSTFKGNLEKIFPASFRETYQWLKFSLNGLRAHGRVSSVVRLLPLASGPACLGMAFTHTKCYAFPPFLVKQFYRCDSVVISSFMRTGYTTRKWGWLLGRIGYSITHHYSWQKHKMDSERDGHARIQHFALNY